MYQFSSRVRYSEVNSEKILTLPALLDYLQDCCIFQSEELGVGVDYLADNHAAWVLSSWQIRICRYPKLGEEITVSTWAYDFKGFYGCRSFKVEGEDKGLLAYASNGLTILGTPARISVFVTGSILISAVSGTCFTHTKILKINTSLFQ